MSAAGGGKRQRRRRLRGGNGESVMDELRNLFLSKEFVIWREEINRENRLAIHMLAVAGLPLSIANIFAQTFFSRRELLNLRTLWLLFYFLALYLFERFVLPQDCKRSTSLLYLLTAPPLLVSILLGTVWDPSHQALTFLMFLMAMPVFIFDHPRRLLGVTLGWCTLFLLLCLAVKAPNTRRGDFFHTLEFFLASSTIVLIVLRVRLEVLRSLAKTRYHLEHDPMTGLRSRYALNEDTPSLLHQPVAVVLGDLDQMTLYNDFYGKRTGDQMLLCFAEKLREVFGKENAYRYGGDEILCVASGVTEQELLDRLAQCREKLRGQVFNGHTLSLTCSFGYAYGTPATPKEFQEIVRLADIYTHSAHRQGQGRTVGGPFDEQNLHSAVTQSVIAARARELEENQLSGLLSLPGFTSSSRTMLENNVDMARQPVIGFFHIIHFRDFNEEFGYAKGDALICYAAKLLQQGFPGRFICNITGSQFGLLCYRDEIEPGLKITNDGLKDYRQDFPIVTKSGFVPCHPGENIVSLLDKAKAAHDTIYNQPNASFCLYSEDMDADNHFRQYIVSHVDEAVEKGWLKVYYQPIVRAVNGEICNEESLSRWDDPTYGFLSPVQFIPVLEEFHLLHKVTLNVVRRVLEDFRVKEEQGIAPVPVSINFSRYDFEECDIVREVTELVDQSGYPRSLLRVEITESAFTENLELLRREVARFRANGFEVWMDDFGSEYSTLNLLQRLEFDLIKIDMEFMRDFSDTGKNMIIVSNVINMAQKMGVSTLVEGIETEDHYRILRKLGCEKLQGFLFSKPISLDNLLQWASSNGAIQYESVKEASYYEAIGSIDLNGLSPADTGREASALSDHTPAGVLEYRSRTFACVRGNDSFYPLLQDLGLLSAARMGTVRQTLTDPAPEALHNAADECTQSTDWQTVELSGGRGSRVTMRLRQVSRNAATGSTALLVVLLPVEQEARLKSNSAVQ